jgi:hypothetical protein
MRTCDSRLPKLVNRADTSSRHASCHRLWSRSPATALASSILGTVVRTLGFMATALICSAFIHHADHAWWFAIRVGLLIGIVTGVGATVNPYIEYYADNLPERVLGYSASDSSSVLLCNHFSIGCPCLMYT